MLHTPDTKTLPVGLADTYASLRIEIGSAYTILFFIMTMPLLVAMQWLGVDATGRRNASAKRLASRRLSRTTRPSDASHPAVPSDSTRSNDTP
jgi:putative spermidine/putrescine transport system permease protein